MDWQPAETAPKDGSHVLLYCPVENRIVSSWWRVEPRVEGGGAWYGSDPMDRLNWIQYPTHWMPLPNPPYAVP